MLQVEKLVVPQNMRLRASTRLLQQTVLLHELKKQQEALLPKAASEALDGMHLLQQQQQQQIPAWQQQQQASDAFLNKLRVNRWVCFCCCGHRGLTSC